MIVSEKYRHPYGGIAFAGRVTRATAERIAGGSIDTTDTTPRKVFDDGRHPVETLIHYSRGPRGGERFTLTYVCYVGADPKFVAMLDACHADAADRSPGDCILP